MKNKERNLVLIYVPRLKEHMFTAVGLHRSTDSRILESKDFFNSNAKNTSTLNAFIGLHQDEKFIVKVCGKTKGYPTKKNRRLPWFSKYYDLKIAITGCLNPAYA
jgi:hypothetical protein